MDWRELSADELEAHYNPRVAVPEVETYLQDYAALSVAARAAIKHRTDLRYGRGPRQLVDVFPARQAEAPIHLYIHGGYWRALSKNEFSFLAPAFVEAGATLVVMDYDLCPDVTVDDIVAQTIDCVAWVAREAAALGGDAGRLYLSGHSAGAHLAAMALAEDWTAHGLPADLIKGATLVSGIYDPEPVLAISVNEEVRLTPEMATRNNACARPPRAGIPILVAVGGDEPAGWIAQSAAYHAIAGPSAELIRVAGADHFSIGLDMADPEHDLCRVMLAQMGLG